MKPEKKNRVALLLHWAGKNRIWLFLAVFLSFISGLCTMVPYLGIYRLMNAVFSHSCTKELIVREAVMIAVAVILRFVIFGLSGVASHKGAYGALYGDRPGDPKSLPWKDGHCGRAPVERTENV